MEQEDIQNLKEIVMRQTDYSQEQALEKLKQHNNDIMSIVREYMGVSAITKKNELKSVNQQIYKEIRTLMDDAAASYKIKKETQQLEPNKL